MGKGRSPEAQQPRSTEEEVIQRSSFPSAVSGKRLLLAPPPLPWRTGLEAANSSQLLHSSSPPVAGLGHIKETPRCYILVCYPSKGHVVLSIITTIKS